MGIKSSQKMRIYHRYLGFFLAGIMAIYSISGIVMIFRNSDVFKVTKQIEQTLKPGLNAQQLGQEIKIRGLKVNEQIGDVMIFDQGNYNTSTGTVSYSRKELPLLLDKMTHMHKATTKSPLFFMNIFFGLCLFFFVLSSFWMFMPGSDVFKKGLYFTLVGVILMLVMVFLG